MIKQKVMSMASAITGFSFTRKGPFDGMKILFHKDALQIGQHGAIVANSVEKRMKNTLVRFVFAGVSEAPKMSPELLGFIWEQAAIQGYEAIYLKSYGTNVSTRVSSDVAGAVSSSRRDAEDARAGQRRDIPVASNIPPLRRERASAQAGAKFDELQQKAEHNSLLRQAATESAG